MVGCIIDRMKFSKKAVTILLVIMLLILPTSVPSAGKELVFTLRSHDIRMEELPGGAESPGGASSFRFEYAVNGERLLFWGWTGPDDVRVMTQDFETEKRIDIPVGFEVQGTRWSSASSVVVWGNNGTGQGDDLLVYQVPSLELDPSFLPREVIPLKTIDALTLLAGDLILVVAGRSEVGTSQVVIIETETQDIIGVHDHHDNLTVQSLECAGPQLLVLDEEGGATIIETGSWTEYERLEPIQGPFSNTIVYPNLPWVFCGESGQVVVVKYNEAESLEFKMDTSPALAACHVYSNVTQNIVVATPKAGGGSIIHVYNNFTGEYELGLEVETEGTVTTIMPYPTGSNNITVGFSNGVVKRYNLWDEMEYDVFDPQKDSDQDQADLVTIPLIVGAIVAIAMIVHRIRNPIK